MSDKVREALSLSIRTLEPLLDRRHLEQKAKPHFAQALSRFKREKERAQLVHDMVGYREERFLT